MSLMPFLKNFVGAGGTQVVENVTAHLVGLAPETASKAELATMEEDLDNAGRTITRLQSELTQEQHSFDLINTQYSEMMAAAELLQKQVDDPAISDEKRSSLGKSLAGLLEKIEHIVPDLDHKREDIEATSAFLKDAETAYQEKSQALLAAKGNLDRAKHDMDHAALEEDRARKHAEDAKVIAGLKTGTGSGLNVALDAMQKTATEARERAAANNMKAKALTSAKDAGEDENVKAALAQVKGTTSEKSLSDRLAQLRR
jgi:chromosome segregation ATPase